MQTFLPKPSFRKSAEVLDVKRLGKQRVEVLQILNALLAGGGWQHHPATLMWRGYEDALVLYGYVICKRWIGLGYRDTCLPKILAFRQAEPVAPQWLGDPAFHRSHRSNLVRKAPDHYRQFFPNVPDNLPYTWPKGAY